MSQSYPATVKTFSSQTNYLTNDNSEFPVPSRSSMTDNDMYNNTNNSSNNKQSPNNENGVTFGSVSVQSVSVSPLFSDDKQRRGTNTNLSSYSHVNNNESLASIPSAQTSLLINYTTMTNNSERPDDQNNSNNNNNNNNDGNKSNNITAPSSPNNENEKNIYNNNSMMNKNDKENRKTPKGNNKNKRASRMNNINNNKNSSSKNNNDVDEDDGSHSSDLDSDEEADMVDDLDAVDYRKIAKPKNVYRRDTGTAWSNVQLDALERELQMELNRMSVENDSHRKVPQSQTETTVTNTEQMLPVQVMQPGQSSQVVAGVTESPLQAHPIPKAKQEAIKITPIPPPASASSQERHHDTVVSSKNGDLLTQMWSSSLPESNEIERQNLQEMHLMYDMARVESSKNNNNNNNNNSNNNSNGSPVSLAESHVHQSPHETASLIATNSTSKNNLKNDLNNSENQIVSSTTDDYESHNNSEQKIDFESKKQTPYRYDSDEENIAKAKMKSNTSSGKLFNLFGCACLVNLSFSFCFFLCFFFFLSLLSTMKTKRVAWEIVIQTRGQNTAHNIMFFYFFNFLVFFFFCFEMFEMRELSHV